MNNPHGERPHPPSVRDIPELKLFRNYTRFTDNLFRIPGTKIRFGIDPILGLIPWAGDLLIALPSMILLLGVVKYGVSGEVLVKMAGNIFIDYLIGNLPIVGDIFDFGFRANARNLRLLEEHWGERKHRGSGLKLIALIFCLMVLFTVLVIFGVWRVIKWALHQSGLT